MDINQIIGLSHHSLHLCTNTNNEEIVFVYALGADVFVTNDTEEWGKKFKEHNINCKIKRPDAIKPSEKIVVDGSSLGKEFEIWEKTWKKQKQVICIYNIDKLDPAILKPLVDTHDKMIFSINNLRLLSDKNLENEISNLDPKVTESLVKRELKNIALSMILSKPMSGVDLVKVLYQKFKVFISPGMLYPALQDLEKKGLLKYEYQLKNKVYSVHEAEQVKVLLKGQERANSLLSQLLVNNK